MVWFRKNWFVAGIIAALILGYLLGDRGETLNPSGITHRIVVLVLFFIIGLTLPTDRIRQDLNAPKLHVLIQLSIFGLAPLVFLTARLFFRDTMDGQLLVGIYALAVLPTTVSSCIVFTQAAGGNTVAAVFNASLANTIGIVLSPILLSLMLTDTAVSMPPGQLANTMRTLLLNMLAPIVAGQLLRLPAKRFIDHNRKAFGIASNVLILVVVILAFSRTSSAPEFTRYAGELPWAIVYLALMHIVLVTLSVLFGRLLRLAPADRITATFVAPQKTLAMGAPLLSVFFSGQPVLGVALLPLVFYHPFQLLVAGLLRSLPFMNSEASP